MLCHVPMIHIGHVPNGTSVMSSRVYKECAVPQCGNSSKNSPNKFFVHVPRKKKIRKKWLNLARRNPAWIRPHSAIYFCEDHFDLPKDMINYMNYHVMGSVSQIITKSGCTPTNFDCQLDRKKAGCKNINRSNILKKNRKLLMDEFEKDLKERCVEVHPSTLLNGPSSGFTVHISMQGSDCCMVNGCGYSAESGKMLIKVPRERSQRIAWFQAANQRAPYNFQTRYFICEDHFDIHEDFIVFLKNKTEAIMKSDTVPRYFNWQDRNLLRTPNPASTTSPVGDPPMMNEGYSVTEPSESYEENEDKNDDVTKLQFTHEDFLRRPCFVKMEKLKIAKKFFPPPSSFPSPKVITRLQKVTAARKLESPAPKVVCNDQNNIGNECGLDEIYRYLKIKLEPDIPPYETTSTKNSTDNNSNSLPNSNKGCEGYTPFLRPVNEIKQEPFDPADMELLDDCNINNNFEVDLTIVKNEVLEDDTYNKSLPEVIRKGSFSSFCSDSNIKSKKDLPKDSTTSKKFITIPLVDKRFRCAYCFALFLQPQQLQSHFTFCIMTKLKGYFQKNNEHSYALRPHKHPSHSKKCYRNITLSRKVTCDKCQRCFSTRSVLKRHLLIHSSIKPFVCEKCGKCFYQRCNMMKHLIDHEAPKDAFSCKICNRDFPSIHLLIWHINENPHRHKTASMFPCVICKQLFLNQRLLELHVDKQHRAERRSSYPCHVCRKYVRPFDIKTHLARHKIIKLHMCSQCGERFSTSNLLLEHKQLQTCFK